MNSSPSPSISVLMPVWNGEKFLAPAIESILHQSFGDFEFLVLYDASTDRSLEIIEEYAARDSRIRVIRNASRQGISAALNLGIEEARGALIARMDCDDISLPGRFQAQLEFMRKNPDVGLCGTNGFSIDESGRVLSGPWWPQDDPIPLEWRLLWETPVAHPTVMMRAELVKNPEFRFRKVPAEDGDLWSRLALRTRIARIPEAVFHYRFSSTSLFQETFKKSVLQAIETSSTLAREVSGQLPPAVHRLLTVYAGDLRESLAWKDIESALAWMDQLTRVWASRWGWSAEIQDQVRKYSLTRITRAWVGTSRWKYPLGRLRVGMYAAQKGFLTSRASGS